MGNSSGAGYEARISVVHHFNCELPISLGGLVVEGLISDLQHPTKAI